jgi:hypothetical protein
MRKSTFETTLTDFHLNMNYDIDLLMKIETAKAVVKHKVDKRSIFEAFVFRICAYWEVLVEDLLIDCLNHDTSRYSEFTGFKLPKNISRETCKAVIIGIGYTDFKSVGQLKKMSKQMLVPEWNPFTTITASSVRKIDEFFKLRNYLAHYSDSARRALLDVYHNTYNMHKFVEPGIFLLARDRQEDMPRMGVYINHFKAVVNKMAEYLGISFD